MVGSPFMWNFVRERDVNRKETVTPLIVSFGFVKEPSEVKPRHQMQKWRLSKRETGLMMKLMQQEEKCAKPQNSKTQIGPKTNWKVFHLPCHIFTTELLRNLVRINYHCSLMVVWRMKIWTNTWRFSNFTAFTREMKTLLKFPKKGGNSQRV